MERRLLRSVWPRMTKRKKQPQEEPTMSSSSALVVKIVRTTVIAGLVALGACGQMDNTPIVPSSPR